MDANEMRRYICETFDGVRVLEGFGTAPTGHEIDYAAVDTVMPHPVYSGQYWVCVVNPGPATLETVRTLVAEAHAFAARKYANREARGAGNVSQPSGEGTDDRGHR